MPRPSSPDVPRAPIQATTQSEQLAYQIGVDQAARQDLRRSRKRNAAGVFAWTTAAVLTHGAILLVPAAIHLVRRRERITAEAQIAQDQAYRQGKFDALKLQQEQV